MTTVVPNSGYSPFLLSFFPKSEKLIPDYQATAEGWVIGKNDLFSTQWIECSYPISGGYGPTPRYIFYALIAVAVLWRKTTWFAAVSLASVMTYSSAAAIHAIVLAAFRTKMAPAKMLTNYGVVLAEGSSTTGIEEISGHNPLWLPVLPMAWDNDDDPVLSIVGVAFLALLPMQLWSDTVKRSEAKSVIALWSGLLLIGVICALVNEAYVDFLAFPQLRFCPPGKNDTLPLVNSVPNPVGGQWDGTDRYYWNRTILHYFENPTGDLPTVCFYPCFATSWPLRDPTEIVALSTTIGSSFSTPTGYGLLLAVYFIVSFSGISSLTILALDSFSLDIYDFHPRRRALRLRIKGLLERLPKVVNSALSTGWPIYRRAINIYARLLSPLALFLFVGWIEWIIWTNDPGGETFRHVGQWGALVATMIVLIAAIIGRYLRNSAGQSEKPRRRSC